MKKQRKKPSKTKDTTKLPHQTLAHSEVSDQQMEQEQEQSRQMFEHLDEILEIFREEPKTRARK